LLICGVWFTWLFIIAPQPSWCNAKWDKTLNNVCKDAIVDSILSTKKDAGNPPEFYGNMSLRRFQTFSLQLSVALPKCTIQNKVNQRRKIGTCHVQLQTSKRPVHYSRHIKKPLTCHCCDALSDMHLYIEKFSSQYFPVWDLLAPHFSSAARWLSVCNWPQWNQIWNRCLQQPLLRHSLFSW
jgi:hypothetical protein